MAKERRTLFYKSVEWALKNYKNAAKLGEQSPLATPYLLGTMQLQTAKSNSDAYEERGKLLQQMIRQGIAQMNGGADDERSREQNVLTKYYIDGLSEVAALDHFSMSKFPFHRLRRSAVEQLADSLIYELQPAVQLENPPQTASPFYGREAERKQCALALAQNKLIWINGPSGVGKSAFGGSLAESWQSERVFWLTIHIGLNDHVQHIAFALGYFLAECGYPALWQECIADAAIVESERLLPVIRYALEQLQQQGEPVLLCIDDIHLLQRTQNADHEQILRLFTSLRSLTPILFMGQRAITDGDEFYPLAGLSPDVMSQWLRNVGFSPTEQQFQSLYTYTQGNPRLIELLLALHKRGVSFEDLLSHLRQTPGIEFLVERIMNSLTADERSVLIELSIFRSAAPLDIWPKKKAREAFAELRALRLITQLDQGQVTLHPVFRDVLYRAVPTDTLKALHKWAAEVFESRGAYTNAIHHWAAARMMEDAIALWKQYGTDEINRGKAYAAYQIFSQIESPNLPSELKGDTKIILAELERFLGNPKQALSTLESIVTQTPLGAIETANIQGEIQNDLGEFDNARNSFAAATRDGVQLIELQLARAYRGQAWAHIRERQLDQALDDALRARYEVENVQGYVMENRHDYEKAVAHYEAAFALAEELAHEGGLARTGLNLARLYGWLGKYDSALRFQYRSEQSYKRLHKPMSLIGSLINHAFLQNSMGNYQSTIDLLSEAEEMANSLPEVLPTWPQALIAQNYAEAYLGLGELDQAEDAVRKAIDFEEEGVLSDAYRTFGEIMHQRGKWERAEEFIRNSITMLETSDEPDQFLLGYAWRALGKLYDATGKAEQASEALVTAVELFREINLEHEVMRTEALDSARD